VKIVVINERHPSDIPGAANIALQFANDAGSDAQVEFWTSSKNRESFSEATFKTRIFKHKYNLDNRTGLIKLYFEFIALRPSFWLLINLVRVKPDVVWINQTGSIFPKTIPLLSRILKIRCVLTLHDFGLIFPRKLYPSDIDGSANPTREKKLVRSFFYKIRRNLLVGISNLSNSIVAISSMQANILKSYNLQIRYVIPNGVKYCACDESKILERTRGSVLFVGRYHGKGFENLIAALKDSDYADLVLVGDNLLQEIAVQNLSEEKIHFYGSLPNEEVLELMHSVEFVAVLSECFDVFPTTVLEAIRHGGLPLVSAQVGNSYLAELISPALLVENNSTLSLEEIRAHLGKVDLKTQLNRVNELISSPIQTLDCYRPILFAD
jgi:glycosyltransferase involved in cell wall biosynthesis